jgi:hypothetical protein
MSRARWLLAGLSAITLSAATVAACGSGMNANVATCNFARSAATAYKQPNTVKAGATDLQQAAQAGATDPQLHSLADQVAAATASSQTSQPGRPSYSFATVGMFGALLDRCQQYQ